MDKLPSGKLTYQHIPCWDRENHLQKCLRRGYVSFLEGIYEVSNDSWQDLAICHESVKDFAKINSLLGSPRKLVNGVNGF